MKWNSKFSCIACAASALVLAAPAALGQIVINEVVNDSQQNPDSSEYVELYNAGGSAVDISNWFFDDNDQNGLLSEQFIPSGTILAAGDYYVIGMTGVDNVDLDVGTSSFLGNGQDSFELYDDVATLVDAVIVERNKLQFVPSAPVAAQTGLGFWGNWGSRDPAGTLQSLSRWSDGLDTNENGRDFGLLPVTPGTSNNVATNANYQLPDADAQSLSDTAPGFHASFSLPVVIDPTIADAFNPGAIPASPQGGNAYVAWDNSGGGNMTASTELVTRYEISAYLDTDTSGMLTNELEGTTYGIGTTGTFYNLTVLDSDYVEPDPDENGNTGVGWFYERAPESSIDLNPVVRISLVDFGPGGDGSGLPNDPNSRDWSIITTIDLAADASDWHTLSIELHGDGTATAFFDDQEFNFNTDPNLVGTFYVGYRESIDGVAPPVRPATFDLIALSGNPADFAGDGDVDGDDFLIWQAAFQVNTNGDADGDGDTDGDDFLIWQANFGSGGSSGAVPEPASAILLLAAAAGAFFRRRRKELPV